VNDLFDGSMGSNEKEWKKINETLKSTNESGYIPISCQGEVSVWHLFIVQSNY